MLKTLFKMNLGFSSIITIILGFAISACLFLWAFVALVVWPAGLYAKLGTIIVLITYISTEFSESLKRGILSLFVSSIVALLVVEFFLRFVNV